MKENAMKRVEKVPALTREQERELESLEALPDSSIDTDDIPEWTDEDFANAIRLNGKPLSEIMNYHKVRKAPITARIDIDVLEWLKSKGEGYQTRLNAILRTAMVRDLRHNRKAEKPSRNLNQHS